MPQMNVHPELNPFKPEIVEKPYEIHEKLREAGVIRIEDGRFLITRFEDVDFVLRRSDLFANVPKTLEQLTLEAKHTLEEFREMPAIASARETGALPSSDPPEHTEYRKMMGPKLSARGLTSFEPKIEEIIGKNFELQSKKVICSLPNAFYPKWIDKYKSKNVPNLI